MHENKEEVCRKNVLGWMKWRRCPPVEIVNASVDRCLLSYSPEFEFWCDCKLDKWNLAITPHQPQGIKSAKKGWREPGATCSAQIILHEVVVSNTVGTWVGKFFEIDFDLYNPNWGVGVALWHGVGEVLRNFFTGSKTNPITVAKKLRKKGVDV